MSPPKAIFLSIRRAFLAGFVLLTPIVATVYVFNILVTAIGGRFRNHFFFFVPEQLLSRTELQIVWNSLATLTVLAVITSLGYLSRYFLARFFIRTTERVIHRLPFINTVYKSVKQIVDTFSQQEKAVFQQTVLIEYPRKGVFALGFLTSTARGEPQAKTESELVNVFVPTTPNPTSGFLLMVPKEEVIPLEMSVGDGMKLIISGGAVIPPYLPDHPSLPTPDASSANLHATSNPTTGPSSNA